MPKRSHIALGGVILLGVVVVVAYWAADRYPRMALIPSGWSAMGDRLGDPDEKPEHLIYLDEFLIDECEVTVAEYRDCVRAGACTEPGTDQSCNWDEPDRPEHPVNCVDWRQANEYCRWAGKRLPTEAEWERAARGTDPRKYPWGDAELDGTRANFADASSDLPWRLKSADDGFQETAPVGRYPAGASPYGVLDMAGNVYEWVWDWYDEEWYSKPQPSNPRGPATGEARVARGGSWNFYTQYLKSSYRNRFPPDVRFESIGIRCARSTSD